MLPCAGRRAGRAMLLHAAAVCGRKVVRRPDDVAGTGRRAASRRTGARAFELSLHPAGKPSADRAKHLADIRIPMLFLQGTRDAGGIEAARACGEGPRPIGKPAPGEGRPIIPSTCWRVRAATTARCWTKYWTRSRTGSTILRGNERRHSRIALHPVRVTIAR